MTDTMRRDRWAGALSALLGLAAGELLAGLVSAAASPAESVARLVVDIVPASLKDAVIAVFGTYDKVVLIAGIAVIAWVTGWWAGGWTRTRWWLTLSVFSAFTAIAVGSMLRDDRIGAGTAIGLPATALITSITVLSWLIRLGDTPAPTDDQPADRDRRRFLAASGSVAGAILVAAAGGRALLERAGRAISGRADVVLPPPFEAAPVVTADHSLDAPGVSPIVTPTADFYRIDTSPFSVPKVALEDWRLRITGMIDRQVEFTYADLLDMDMEERHITIACVSNQVGGDLIGTARWQGIPLRDLLDRAGVAQGAEQIVGRSVDEFTVGFPVEAAFDGRHALLALGMNGEPLPFAHGFPARLVVAGLYGYVSATKWLSEIELTTWDGFDAYWIRRRWAKEAPIKTQSRIDTPRHNATIRSGARAIAGVAWAPTRGISAVQVEIDGTWHDAQLSEPLSDDTWRQWSVSWDGTPGSHTLRVRAADGGGNFQDEVIRPPAPDGATGFHTVQVRVGDT